MEIAATQIKIGALIPVRLNSERLPGKHLKEVGGRPLIHHLLRRVEACRHLADPRDIVVCTTLEHEDDALIPVVESFGARVFRGARDDIIRRFRDAIHANGFDLVIQVNGDNMFCDPEYMAAGIDSLLAHPEVDVTTCTGLPIGVSSTCFTRDAIDKVYAAYRSERNDTGFVLFFTRTGICRHMEIPPLSPNHVMDAARLTLDYSVDLEVFTRIIEALDREDAIFSLDQTLTFLRENPVVAALNAGISIEYDARTRQLVDLKYVAPDGAVKEIVY